MKKALFKLHTAVFLWGFTGVLGRLISLNEGLLVWYRLLITIVTLYFLMRAKKQLESVSPKQRWQLFAIGSLVAMHWCFFYGSIKYSNVSIALTCLSSTGLFTALLEPLIKRKKAVLMEILLGLVAIAGIYLIFHFDPQYKTGIILGIISSILTCVFSIFNKTQVSYNAPRTVMLYELTGGFFVVTLLMPLYLYLLPAEHWFPVKTDLIWFLFLSWICTILAMDLSLQALQKVSAFTQNLTLNLEPVYGIILAFVVYNENKYLSKWFYFGFVLILLAVILQMLRLVNSRKKTLLES
ncbi:MAG: EamA/RhaT family transporter [Segetibacter sp.]|nr:EamA/RhaT family transporter [Segetibacter sp.]